MIVETLKKDKKNAYQVVVDGVSYVLDEEVVLEYRLVQGKEISKDTLKQAISKNHTMEYYNKALSYVLKYGKSSDAVLKYLLDKEVTRIEAEEIIERLKKIKAIDDETLISNLVDSLARKGNGKLLIEKKLYEQKFSSNLIAQALTKIDEEAYFNAMMGIYEKVKNKYKDEPYIKMMKIKKYLLSRGYTYSDIQTIDFKA